MITPAQVREKALRAYPDYLASLVTGDAFFPLEIRFGKKLPKGDFHEFDRMRSSLLNASKMRGRTGYCVELAQQQTRRYGEVLVPSRIFFESESDYLAGIDKTTEAARFKELLAITTSSIPGLLPLLGRSPLDVLPCIDVWLDLLSVCRYFMEHPRPGCYIRELPLEVHTKFIEEHAGILRKMLDEVLPEHAYDPEESRFTARYGLREAEPLIRVRFLNDLARTVSGLSVEDAALPATAFCQIDFSGLNVVIVENLMTFLTLPAICGDAVIFGKGFQVGVLKDSVTLGEARLFYWSDLDAQGFMMLSQLRSSFPHVRSALMDQRTLEDHREFIVNGTPCTASRLPGLSENEEAMFEYLRANELRLEQERISLRYVRERWL